MKKEKRFELAYLTLIIPILVKFFYSWLIQGKQDYFLLTLICVSTVVFVVGSVIDKKGGES